MPFGTYEFMRDRNRQLGNTNDDCGFTIIELLISMAVLVILAATSISHYQDLAGSFSRWNTRTYIIQDLRYAQAKSISEGCRMVINIFDDASGYEVGCDYLNYDTTAPVDIDNVFFSRVLPAGVTISTDSTMIFNPKGQIINPNGQLSTRTLSMTFTEGETSGNFMTISIVATGAFSIS